MGNKYIQKDFFAQFKNEIGRQEKQNNDNQDKRGPGNKFPNPSPGNEYKIRFLPDASGKEFYKKFYYHMYEMDGSGKFSLCPKTFDMEAYCPLCAATAKLYKSGTEADKQEAGRFKRKEKFVANIFVVNDPRDQDKDEDKKMTGTVKIFEFATKLESNIRVGIFDDENGVGAAGFDPTDDGINFVIRVTETKPQADGKKWPDYATSSFARNSSAIADSDAEVDEIMSKVVDLNEYLKVQLPDESKIIDDLKEEQVFDIIADDYARILAKRNPKKELLNDEVKAPKKPAVNETESTSEEEAAPKKAEPAPKKEAPKKTEADALDEELLAELNNM